MTSSSEVETAIAARAEVPRGGDPHRPRHRALRGRDHGAHQEQPAGADGLPGGEQGGFPDDPRPERRRQASGPAMLFLAPGDEVTRAKARTCRTTDPPRRGSLQIAGEPGLRQDLVRIQTMDPGAITAERDELYEEAVGSSWKASAAPCRSRRNFGIGSTRAARLMDLMARTARWAPTRVPGPRGADDAGGLGPGAGNAPTANQS